jgi:hypothetical protein
LATLHGIGSGAQFAKLVSLTPTLVLSLVALTVIEGYGGRLPLGSPAARLGVLLGIACVASSVPPALVAQAIYLEETFGGGGSLQGLGQVQGAFERGILPGTLLFSFVFLGLPAAFVAFPRVRSEQAPTAQILLLSVFLSVPLLFSGEPILYWFPIVILSGWSMLYSAGDGVEGFLFAPFEAEAAELRLRRERGELSLDQLQLAADLGHGPARRALQLPLRVVGTTPSELISRLEGPPALGRVMVLLAQLTFAHANDPQQSRAACQAIARQLLAPSQEHLAEVQAFWPLFPWTPPPQGSANQRAVHFALELTLAPPGTSRGILDHSIRGALRAVAEVASRDQILAALRDPIVAWVLAGEEPLACVGT